MDCPRCGNTGQIIERGPGLLELHVYECPCMKQRRSLRSLRKAGMADMARRCTLENYLADNDHRKAVKTAALRYLESPEGWFFIAGRSGSGKTHICTAICTALITGHRAEVCYVSWRDKATELKGYYSEPEKYQAEVKKLKSVQVLYIDDFFKGGASDADLRLAFVILNARYNDTALRTIISSEKSLEEITALDEALGSRIKERCKGFLVKSPPENWRLRS